MSSAEEERQATLQDDTVLDQAKLSAAVKKGEIDIFVLQWLAKAEVALKNVTQEFIQAKQRAIEQDLLSLVYTAVPEQSGPSGISPTPARAITPALASINPGRPVRHILARCFVIVIGRGESRSLFDVIQTLLRIGADEKQKTATSSPSKEARVAALYILGEIFGKLGDQVMSLFIEITVVTQRLFKAPGLPPILRYHALQALRKALLIGGRSLNDQPGKELLKGLRQGLADSAAAVVRGCADCISTLLEKTSLLSTRSEIDLTVHAGMKTLESADFLTKRALSRMCAALLAYTQVENSAPIPQPAKKAKKKKVDGAEEDSDEADAAQQAAASAALAAADGGPERTLMSAVTMLDEISQAFLRQGATRRARAAYLDLYASLLSTLGHEWVLRHYSTLLRHFMDSLPNHIRGTSNRAESLFVRAGVGIIVRNLIGERMLDEQAQVAAIQEISSLYLNRWPALMPGQNPPSKYTLVIAFNECSGLLAQLGSAPPQVQEAVYEPAKRCLGHPSHSVQVAATWCLRTLCDVYPLLMSNTITSTLESLEKDLTALTSGNSQSGPDLSRRARGRAIGLAALINIIPHRPLYVSFEVCSKVIDLAITLLKESGNNELPISAVQIQVAWTLIGSLMSLGPNFVRLYLSQMLSLWRNALPKPTAADTSPTSRSDAEWGFLLHVRECTLSALLPFLKHNAAALVTLDTARRLVVLLSNTLAFVNNFTSQHPHIAQEQVPGTELSSITLLDREQLLRRRLLQCFVALANNPAMEVLRGSMISVAMQVFSEPDRYIGSAAQAAIAASAGNFSSIWNSCDGYAFGVTSLQRDDETFIALSDDLDLTFPSTMAPARADWLNRDAVEVQLDALQRRPILGAAEHDLLSLYSTKRSSTSPQSRMVSDVPGSCPQPPPPATGVVDAAIELFAAMLPSEERETQISTLETLLAYCRSPKLDKNPGRKMAIQLNSCVAVLGVLRAATRGAAQGRKVGGFNNHRVSTALQEILRLGLLHRDSVLRAVGSVAYGRLAASSGSHAMSAQVRFLIDTIVSNRDPDARAGCALAFGAIYSEVGGLAAVPLKEEVLNVLMSLATDPHPTVHFYALEALRMVIDAASLSYSPFVGSTLGMLVKLYMVDTHESEGGSAGSVALRADTPALQAACGVITALIGVLGPDLNESTRTRSLILTLLLEFSAETDDGVIVEALRSRQNFGLFAERHVDTTAWIEHLSACIRSSKRPVQVAATNAFYQLVQRQALMMSKIGGDRLVESLFAQLDSDPNIEGIREVILSWLRQTADLSPLGWIDLCKRIMTHTIGEQPVRIAKSAAPKSSANAALQDEESATLQLGDGSGPQAAGIRSSRWRTQLFALRCLHEVFLTVRRSGRLEHFTTPAPGSNVNKAALMSSRVGELIKVAFTASTASNAEIRLEGLTILRDVIDNFKLAQDPDFTDALLLEQHQAPIAAALTPAFLADSTPEVLAAAVGVCAAFVGSGVVREVERMGRILKQLISAIETCKQPTMSRLGDVPDLSPNTSAMLKVAVFSAWADLQVASAKQSYLVQVVEPHVETLTPLWIASLREYARIKGDPEGAGIGAAGPGPVVNPSLDSEYASLAREAIMPYYDRSWFKLLEAVSMLMDQDVEFVRQAMNGKSAEEGHRANGIKSNGDHSLFFFVLYGLAFESLVTSSGAVDGRGDADGAAHQTRIMATALQAMRNLLRAQYAGLALLNDNFFDEWCSLASRLVMTETATVQLCVVEMVASFAASHKERLLGDDFKQTVFPTSSKLTQCLRIVVYALGRGMLSGEGSIERKAAVVRAAYSAFIAIVLLYPPELREELFTVGFHTWADMLHAEGFELDLVAPALPSLKALCESAPQSMKVDSDALPRAIHGFLSAALQNVDDMRTRAGRVADLKTRNSLLAVTVALTSLPASAGIVHASVAEHLCFLLTQKALEATKEEVDVAVTASGVMALNCMRSIIVAAARGPMVLQYCIGQLLPGLVEVLANTAMPLLSQREATDPRLALSEEAMKALMAVVTVAGDTNRAAVLSIVLPTLILLLNPEPSSTSNPPCHTASISHIVSIASTDPLAFRASMATLDVARREALETSIRNALSVGAAKRVQETTMPKAEASISLRSFGS